MKSIYTYSDYRLYIKDFIQEKRSHNPSFSDRCAALKIGISSGSLTRILNGTRHVGESVANKMIEFLGLRKNEGQYFLLLVKYAKADNEAKRTEVYQLIKNLQLQLHSIIPEDKHLFFENWYNLAIYELLRVKPEINNLQNIGDNLIPIVSESKIKKSIDLLLQLGYIEQTDNKTFKVKNSFLSTGERWDGDAIHALQIIMSQLAVEALNRFPKKERDFSTYTSALSPKAYNEVKQLLANTRKEIEKIEKADSKADKVYQINLQLFPLSKTLPNDLGEE